MATLHVRNVPDELYERLRAQAESDGRSIGAEAVQLLDQQLGGGSRRGLRRRRGGAPTPGGRFSDRTRAVATSALEEAVGLGHSYVGTEHLLLGLLAHRPLAGMTLEQARRDAVALVGRGEGETPTGYLPYTARAKKVLDLADRDARPGAIEPEHIALGILGEGEGVGFKLLSRSAPDLPSLRAELNETLETSAPFRVLELAGEAGDWEAALNDAAAAGYELVSVFDRRVVLRLTI
jgi:Clp amino terminal domain, pathogenicity island component